MCTILAELSSPHSTRSHAPPTFSGSFGTSRGWPGDELSLRWVYFTSLSFRRPERPVANFSDCAIQDVRVELAATSLAVAADRKSVATEDGIHDYAIPMERCPRSRELWLGFAGADGLIEFLESIPRDTARRNCWPVPFVYPDRQSAREPFVTMVCNGWQRQNMLSAQHFNPETGKLTEAGQAKIQWILNEAPEQHRAIFVHRARNPQETADHVAAVQRYVIDTAWPGEYPPVMVTTRSDEGSLVAEYDLIARKFRDATMDPKLPAGTTGSAGGSSTGSTAAVHHPRLAIDDGRGAYARDAEEVVGGRTRAPRRRRGTQLQQRGMPPEACPDGWNLTHPEVVEQVARGYVEAGSQVILTNTFGANRVILARHGLADQMAAINTAGVEISRCAAVGRALVFASMGPSGILLMMGETSEDELRAVFADQAQAIAKAGADGIVVETMSDLAEAALAVAAAHETGLPVVGCMTYGVGAKGDRTMMGVTPEQAAEQLLAAGAECVGSNCGQGVASFVEIARRLHVATQRPVWIKANAGLPELSQGKTIYRQTPEEFATFVPALVEAGAGMIGGCCGTTPAFIAAVRRALE